MILKTKKAVKFNNPQALTGGGEAVLLGALQNVSRTGQNYLGANYAYALEDGKAILQSAFELKSKEEILGLNAMIKNDLPIYEDVEETYFEELKYMLAFRLQMVQSLIELNPDLTPSDISIVDEEGNAII